MARAPRAGLSILEVLVTLSILVVAGSLFCQMLISGRRIRLVNHEKTLAADAARVVLERMRNTPFLEVYRDYNEDPTDDPGGNGTGPGSTFEVEGLSPMDGASAVGRVLFPSMAVQVASGGGGGGKLGGLGGGSLGGTTVTQYHVREDLVDARLGMPRDLTGDNRIDSANHSADYLLLPVCVRLEWKSGTGERRFEIVTQLGDFLMRPAALALLEEAPVLEEAQ
ncbi:MAG TPA: hypothetical protein VF530_13000 [Planctomycetota bacterium]